ncbi:hypothetical protein [Acidiphilium sp.]|uniref:hypothetical protein n=1 Tax=Acidiphilium sp. TaxID=527 RepID=UPI003D06C3B8
MVISSTRTELTNIQAVSPALKPDSAAFAGKQMPASGSERAPTVHKRRVMATRSFLFRPLSDAADPCDIGQLAGIVPQPRALADGALAGPSGRIGMNFHKHVIPAHGRWRSPFATSLQPVLDYAEIIVRTRPEPCFATFPRCRVRQPETLRRGKEHSMTDWKRRRRQATTLGLIAAMTVTLAGCGADAGNRMSGGAAGGAATGATFGLIGGPIGVLVGGAVGGGIGALTAANTTPKQVNLGNPPWAGGAAAPATNEAGPGPANAAPQQLAPAPMSSSRGYTSGTGSDTGYGGNSSVQAQPLAPPG